MKFTQRPKAAAAPAPIVSALPAQAPAPVEEAAPAAPEGTPEPKPTAFPEKTAPAPAPKAAAPVQMGHHSRPMLRTPPAAAAVAQNLPPAQAQPPVAQPAPAPVQQPAAPPIAIEPAPVTAPAPAPVAESVEPPAPQQAPSVTLQAGMTLAVRLGESLSSEHNQAGDTFTATLDAPLSAGGFVIAERGARVEGRVMEAGHAKGKATLALELSKLNTSDGQHVDIKTEILRKQGATMATGDQVGIVAAAAGIGAVIGAIAGGGKGAAIGAGVGGAAGGGGVVATRDKAVTLPTESRIAFRLSAPVTITERLNQ